MIAEIPGATLVLADPTNYRARVKSPSNQNGNGYTRVVCHGTSGRADPMGPAEMWQKPHAGSSAHLVIGEPQMGRVVVVQCVPLRFAAYHAHEANDDSIGVEHCIRAPGTLGPNDPGQAPSDALYRVSARTVAYLLKAAGLTPDRATTVRGHAEVDTHTTHTVCPVGDGFDWSVYFPLLQQEYEALNG